MAEKIGIPDEMILDQIYYIRGQKIMIDADLASLYEVETKQLKRQVRRNIERFPPDFMFELSLEEYESSRCQFGTLKKGENIKYSPMAFTEQGVAMLSSVLNSKRAIEVNIQIIRIFTRIRQLLVHNTELRLEIEKIKASLSNQDKSMEIVFDKLDQLLAIKDTSESEMRSNTEMNHVGFKNWKDE